MVHNNNLPFQVKRNVNHSIVNFHTQDLNLQLNISMQCDVAGIKKTLEDMASEVREEIACIKENLEELSYKVREERDNISYILAEILAEIQHDREYFPICIDIVYVYT